MTGSVLQDRENPEASNLLSLADNKLKEHLWSEAGALYEQVLDKASLAEHEPDLSFVTDSLAWCRFNAAFQSVNRQEFIAQMDRAADLYDKAAVLYRKASLEALAKRSESRFLFAKFWLEQTDERRRPLVEKCISHSLEAKQAFEKAREERNLLETCTDILSYSLESLHLATDWNRRHEEFERILYIGRETVSSLEKFSDDETLTRGLHPLLWTLAAESELILKPTEFKKLAGETVQLNNKLTDAARRINLAYASCVAQESSGNVAWNIDGNLDGAVTLYRSAMELAGDIKDSLTMGRLCTLLAGLEHWRAAGQEYREERREIIEQGLRYGREAVEHLKIGYHTSYLSRAHSLLALLFIDLADHIETDRGDKRMRLSESIDFARKGMNFERLTQEWLYSAHELSKAMYFLSTVTSDPLERTQLLKDALPIRQETVRVTDALQPHSWNRGVMRNYLALLKSELANLEDDPNVQSELVGEAASHMEECLDWCRKWEAAVAGSAHPLARYSEWYGDILYKLFRLQAEQKVAEAASKAYIDAVEYLKKSGQASPIPAVRWKIAKLHDTQGQYSRAAEDFAKAAEEYRYIADNVPGTSLAFHEVAIYMDAWKEIENARLHHEEEEYRLAFEEYSRAATKLQATNPWRYLSSICTGRASLEEAEELSREEKHEDSIESLAAALQEFRKAKGDLEARVTQSTGSSEIQEQEEWLRHTIQRETYSQGRIALEEAKALDKKGDKTASSRKYQSASETFRSLASQTSSSQDGREMETLARFCDSWAKMKMAESRSSPELFADAAESFSKVVDTTEGQTPRLLALANASICKALESGTRFRLTRNPQLYSDAKRHLETAADCYTEAGFKKTGNWTRATQRLFDALVFLADAETERDPRKKTELYYLAEKQLELAGRLYGEAGFPSKKQETIEQLERTREEKETLLTALQTLAEIPTASTTVLTSIPPNRSQAPGLGRFEDANLAGEVLLPGAGIVSGSDFTMTLDMVNVGKTPATLVRLENIIPDGVQPFLEESDPQLQGNALDLRGKRLEYLKTHTVKIPLRTTRKGNFDFGPRVIFVDDKGNYRSYEFRSTVMTVREPGISEAIGPSPVVSVPAEFRFEDERSREVFRYLVKVFVDDYMSRRIVEDRAGWRTMMKIIAELKIPRSAFYGPEKKTGPVLLELERRGLVETRVFLGERGRGGDIRKVRVAFENTIVRRIVEQAVMQNR